MNAAEILDRVLAVGGAVEEEEGMVGEEEADMEEIHMEEGLGEEEAGVIVAQIMVVAIDMNPTMVDAHRAEDGVLVEVIKMMVVDVMEVAVHKIAIAGMNGKPPFEFLASCCLFE